MQKAPLPVRSQAAYACGMMGWSILINLIGVILVYLYLPPSGSGLPSLISQVAILGIFNLIALITAGGRLLDALYDPIIAQYSDTLKHPEGRRIPLMRRAILPCMLFCFLVFYPLKNEESSLNVYWLIFSLAGFYISTTTYIIPYNALLPQLAPNSAAKVRLATWQSAGYVFGIGISSNAFNISSQLQASFELSKMAALQVTVLLLSVLAALFMLVTVLGIDERKYQQHEPVSTSMRRALSQTIRNRNFLYFIAADFSYFVSVTLITSGLMYFVTVLLPLSENIGNRLMITMVLVSFVFYPLTNWAAAKVGKKRVVLISLSLLAFIFFGIYLLGKFAFAPELQIYTLIALAAIPLASLNILPNAILSEIIQSDTVESGQNKEAMYFAVRYFFVKIAQTLGIAGFSMLLLFGKDTGNDLGIRLNGILGCGLCLVAALVFSRFKER